MRARGIGALTLSVTRGSFTPTRSGVSKLPARLPGKARWTTHRLRARDRWEQGFRFQLSFSLKRREDEIETIAGFSRIIEGRRPAAARMKGSAFEADLSPMNVNDNIFARI